MAVAKGKQISGMGWCCKKVHMMLEPSKFHLSHFRFRKFYNFHIEAEKTKMCFFRFLCQIKVLWAAFRNGIGPRLDLLVFLLSGV